MQLLLEDSLIMAQNQKIEQRNGVLCVALDKIGS